MVAFHLLALVTLGSLSKGEWTSGINERFAGARAADFERMIQKTPIQLPPNIQKLSLPKKVGLPDSFSAANLWSSCADGILNVRDQGGCASGWASAAAAAMSDATCIKCGGQYGPYLSEEDILSCKPDCGDCNGGNVLCGYQYWLDTGLVTGGPFLSERGCLPYTVGPNNTHGPASCPNACGSWYGASYTADKRKGSTFSTLGKADDMQNYLYLFGPIVSANFTVYADFKNYKDGIYQHTSGDKVGTHAVKIIGWGADKNVPYWLAVNSFGTKWGANGIFKIKRGTNECGIESVVITAQASTDGCFVVGTTQAPTTRKSGYRFSPAYMITLILPSILLIRLR